MNTKPVVTLTGTNGKQLGVTPQGSRSWIYCCECGCDGPCSSSALLAIKKWNKREVE